MTSPRTPTTPKRLGSAYLLAALAALSGCAANLSGIGGETTFKCKAPDGVQCQSVSGTYANARVGNLPSQQGSPKVDLPGSLLTRAAADPTASPQLGAIRSDPTLIRIWVAPWEDADGDLMDQSYVYLAIDTGRWLIEHNRQRIKRQFAPVRAPAGAAAAPAQSVPPRAAVAAEDEEGAPDGAAALATGIALLRNGGNRPDAPTPGAQP